MALHCGHNHPLPCQSVLRLVFDCGCVRLAGFGSLSGDFVVNGDESFAIRAEACLAVTMRWIFPSASGRLFAHHGTFLFCFSLLRPSLRFYALLCASRHFCAGRFFLAGAELVFFVGVSSRFGRVEGAFFSLNDRRVSVCICVFAFSQSPFSIAVSERFVLPFFHLMKSLYAICNFSDRSKAISC